MRFDTLQGTISYFAIETPQKIAIKQGEVYWTYQQLEQFSNRVASFFSTQQGQNRMVLVLMDKSPELIGTILGIVKSGGIFIPLDPNYPEERLSAMLNEVPAQWIVLQAKHLEKWSRIVLEKNQNIHAVIVGDQVNSPDRSEGVWEGRVTWIDHLPDHLGFVPTAENVNKHAYIYFTSGSTGMPKGVLGRHRSLLHFIEWEIREFGISSDFTGSQLTSPSFDPFLRDIFVPLCAGGTVAIPPDDDVLLIPQKLCKWIETEQVGLMHMTPSLLKSLLTGTNDAIRFADVRYIMLAGEKLKGRDVSKFLSLYPEIQLVNLYGPTETTLAKFFYRIRPEDGTRGNIPVGKPMDRTELLLLDGEMKRCRTETIGEVYIRTPFISSGYYNRPDVTREVFLRNPFTDHAQDIIYKTGDLGILLPDGNLELVGRVDHQVKIRGMRVEPGEIENQILQYPAVKEVVVVVREEGSDARADDRGNEGGGWQEGVQTETYLVAYLVWNGEFLQGVDSASIHQTFQRELKSYLSKRLPEHMVPAHFLSLEALPLTPNGKVDRKALPAVDWRANLTKSFVHPTTPVEVKLAEIWQEVLGIETVGICDDFFELGGHSLKAASVVAKVFKEYKVELGLREFFASPTIQTLAEVIQRSERRGFPELVPCAIQEFYPLSSAQKRLFFLHQLNPNNSYNLPRALLIEGDLDRSRLLKAVQQLVERHESLRTSFLVQAGEPVQRIEPHVNCDLEEWNMAQIDQALQEFIRPFDLTKAPLFRVGLIHAPDKWVLCFDLHHIIADGSSMGILVQDFIKLYNGEDLPALHVQYKDYVVWQTNFFASGSFQEEERFWLERFQGEIPVLHLPADFSRPKEMIFAGDTLHFSVPLEVTIGLRNIAHAENATLFMVLLAVYSVLLSRYTGSDEIIVGSPVANRRCAEVENVIGMFVNTLALQSFPEGKKGFLPFLAEVREGALAAFDNGDYPLEMLVDRLKIERDLSRNPLFDTVFVVQNAVDEFVAELAGLQVRPYEFTTSDARFDLALNVFETLDGLDVSLTYCTALFQRSTVERFARHWLQLLHAVVLQPESQIGVLEMLTSEERRLILQEFSTSGSRENPLATLVELFLQKVTDMPDQIAIELVQFCPESAEGQLELATLTYGQLNQRANQLVHALRARGVGREDVVALLATPSLEMAVGLFAILKAGAAYLPLDPATPAERIQFILQDCRARLLLIQSDLEDTLSGLLVGLAIQVLNMEMKGNDPDCGDNLPCLTSARDAAYVIYTSGSTGRPKGVLIEHRSILNTLLWRKEEYHLGSQDRVLQLFSFAFDGFVTAFFTPLLTGARVVLLGNEGVKNPRLLKKVLLERQITHCIATPALYGVILELLQPEEQSLKTVVLAGDRVNLELIEKTRRLGFQFELANEYGPTENSVATTVERNLQVGATVTIGRPIVNTWVSILTPELQPVPVGVAGELWISGVGLARNYLNRPELTAERFVENPFRPGERMYRTGDLARWLSDGRIEFVGRTDDQVKIRGYRIELGEIEDQLLRHPEVQEVAVLDRRNPNGDPELVAYYRTVSEAELSDEELRQHICQYLPDYMCPAYFIPVRELPRLTSGKIDRKALPVVSEKHSSGYIPPQTGDEEIFAKIWMELLGKESVSRNDDFFDLGGDSIKAIQMIARAGEQGMHLTVKDIFRYKRLASILEHAQYKETMPVISQAEVVGEVPLTPIQSWFFAQNHLHPEYFHQANLFTLPVEVDVDRLEKVFRKLIERHDALRMGYVRVKGEIFQYNRGVNDVDFRLESVDLSSLAKKVQEDRLQKICTEMQGSFTLFSQTDTTHENPSLGRELLLKAAIFDLGSGGKRLFLAFHHLIIDGVSWRILMPEMESLYRTQLQGQLPPKTTSFKEWSERLRDYTAQRVLTLRYWEQIDPTSIPSLTHHATRSDRKDYAVQYMELAETETRMLLTQTNQTYGTSTEELLLAGFALTMKEVFGQHQILINLEGHGRDELLDNTNLTRTVGWFTNVYPVLLPVHSDLKKAIVSIKESLRRIGKRGFNFGLARYYQQNSQMQKLNPEITFNYLGQFTGTGLKEAQNATQLLSPALEEIGPRSHPDNHQKTLFDCNAAVADDRLQISLRYHTGILSQEKISKFAEIFRDQLEAIIEHCLRQTSRIFTVSDYDLQHLLDEEDYSYLLTVGKEGSIPGFTEGVPKVYGLTPMQQGMLFHSLDQAHGRQYIEQICFYLKGDIQSVLLPTAWQIVVNRHEALRTCFVWQRLQNPVQIILEKKEAEIWQDDLVSWSDSAQKEYIAQQKEKGFARKFDFVRGELNHLALVKLSEDRYFVCWTFHHIIMDGWSGSLILRELVEVYQALSLGKPLPKAVEYGFSRYLDWVQEQDSERALYFWQNYLEEFADAALLTGVISGLKSESIEKVFQHEIRLSPEKTLEIEELCKNLGITLNTYVQAAWGLLLTRYTNRTSCCFGMTVAGRPASIAGIEQIVGLFINTLPVLMKPQPGMLLSDLLCLHNERLVEVREYEYISLAELQKLSPREGQLFDSLVVFENYPVQSLGAETNANVRIELDSIFELTNYPVVITASATDGLFIKLSVREGAIETWLAERIGLNLAYLLEEMANSLYMPVQQIEVIAPAERALLLGFNATRVDYERDKTIVQLFVEQVVRTPDHPAVVAGETVFTYRELNLQADDWAKILHERGIGVETIVGVLLEPSVEMLVGILAVLKAGAAYLPIDPEYPEERINYMLEDSQAALLITRRHFVEEIGFMGEIDVLEAEQIAARDRKVGTDSSDPHREEVADSRECSGSAASPTDAAYIIYTSGSSGKPKGVVVEHRALVNLVTWHNRYYAITENDRSTKYAGTSFDASVWEIFPYLVVGAAIYIVPAEIRHNLWKLDEFFAINKITVSFLPTLVCEEFMRLHANASGSQHLSLRVLLTGGDKLRTYYPTGYQVINNYGPTENTVVTTCYPVQALAENIPIGRPIANTQVFILDHWNRLQPLGAPGELCIKGDGLARGYVNRPDLTAERFVTPIGESGRMYKTGDVARWLPDGNLTFLGRLDEQIKIRGYRVEPGEIEQVLLRDSRVKDAIVLERKDSGSNGILTLFYTATEPIAVEQMQESLGHSLPDYMIPTRFIYLEQIPQTPHGKADRAALLKYDLGMPIEEEETDWSFESEFAERLALIWREVLGVAKVRPMDHFFELGGHSLKATQLAARILKEWNLEIPLRDLFTYPTLRTMAAHLQMLEKTTYPTIPPAGEQEYYPVSSAQKRIYALYMLNPETTAYNIPGVLTIDGQFDLSRFSATMQQLMERHEALRTSFAVVDGEVVQRIQQTVAFVIGYEEVQDEEIEERICKFIQPFDLGEAPLLRACVLKNGDRHLFLLDLHHIIADGSSMAILVDELALLYQGEELPPLRMQYKDYSVWQRDFLGSEAMRQQESFWLEQFAGEIPVLHLPTDYVRPQKPDYAGGRVGIQLDRETTAGLYQLSLRRGTTLFMTLLTGYGILLGRYSGQEDIVIGTPIAGRNHPDLEKVTGMFVNTLALRVHPTGEKSVAEVLSEVKDVTLQAYEYQDYPLEFLVEKLPIERDLSRNPLFDTMLAVQNTPQSKVVPELQFQPYPFTNPVSKFDLTVNVVEEANQIWVSFEYRKGLFQVETVERMARHYCNILREMVNEPQKRIAAVEMISAWERQEILEEFNRTKTAYPHERVIHELFSEQVRRTPDQMAVVYNGYGLTYQELNCRANQLARLLRDMGIGVDQVVGIMTGPSTEMLVGILAILKAGGAYLPIDPAYPAERIRFMLETSGAPILLVQGQQVIARLHGNITGCLHPRQQDQVQCNPDQLDLEGLSSEQLAPTQSLDGGEYPDESCDRIVYSGEVLDLSDLRLYQGEGSELEVVTQPTDLAYIIFTSGSTGKPKGVMVEHHSLVNLTCWHQAHSAVTANDRSTKYAGFGFDASILEIFPYITAGATIYMIPEEIKLNLDALAEFFRTNQITTSFLPTPIYEQFMWKESPGLRQLLTGGDKLKHYVPQRYKVIDNYGPAENTVTTTVFEVNGSYANIPIGKPIANVQIYILNPYGNLQPVGVPGELCIAGDGLARGYLGRPDLTAERFVPDPFEPGKRMYKTGDLARWLANGNLEFLGRLDEQVKIRGYRIEIGEIETLLQQHERIRQAVVIVRDDENGGKYLVAYLTSEEELPGSTLRAFLATSLPEYMIPAFFVHLQTMPLTPNGKVDKRALPEPDVALVNAYVAPTTVVEKQLAEIWAEYLGQQQVGLDDNFFELGGDSIKAIQIQSKASQAGIYLTVENIFQLKTIAQILANVDYGRNVLQVSSAEVSGEMPLTPIQHWFLEQGFVAGHFWNQTNLFALPQDVDLELLKRALEKLIAHHDGLRISFTENGGKYIQYNRAINEVEFELLRVDLTSLNCVEQEEELKARCFALQDGVELARDLLLKAVVFDLGSRGQRLFLMIHHLLIDGISWRVLLEDLELLYRSKGMAPLPPKSTSYKEWSEKLVAYAAESTLDTLYWAKIEQNNIPTLRKETREPVFLRDFRREYVELGSEETDDLLRKANHVYNTRINDLLLAGLLVAAGDSLGMSHLFITLEGHGREAIIEGVDLGRTIGWFTAMYPVYLTQQANLEETIKHVKETLRRVQGNGLHYGIARYLLQDPSLTRFNPEMSFNYLGQLDGVLQDGEDKTNPGLLRPASEEVGSSIHPDNQHGTLLDFVIIVVKGQLRITLHYNSLYISGEVVRALLHTYVTRLQELINHCTGRTEQVHTASDFAVENILSDEDFELLKDIYDL